MSLWLCCCPVVLSQSYGNNLIQDPNADSPPPPPLPAPQNVFVWPSTWIKTQCNWSNNGWACSTPLTCDCAPAPSYIPDFTTQTTATGCEMYQDVLVTGYQEAIDRQIQVFRLTVSVSQFYIYCLSSYQIDYTSNHRLAIEYRDLTGTLISIWWSSVLSHINRVTGCYDPPWYTSKTTCPPWSTHWFDVTAPIGTRIMRVRLLADRGTNDLNVVKAFTLFDNIMMAAQYPQPTNCVWNTWGSWSGCSASCAGTQTRTRTYQPALFGGNACNGSATEIQTCSPPCPVDCVWNSWSQWTDCNDTCNGWQYRSRTYIPAQYSGLSCVGPNIEYQSCSPPCPIDCVWNPWQPSGNCNASCGGWQPISRTSIPAQYGGESCTGTDTDIQPCTPCPIDCQWNEWEPWGSCNASCGGWITRYRSFVPALYGGLPCYGKIMEQQRCSADCTPIDCTWNSWQPWIPCFVDCGGGIQVRFRTYNPPLFGGKKCTGNSTDYQSCKTDPCPFDCIWSEWGPWSDCITTDNTCSGSQNRNRTKINEQNGGNSCIGLFTETRQCTLCEQSNLDNSLASGNSINSVNLIISVAVICSFLFLGVLISIILTVKSMRKEKGTSSTTSFPMQPVNAPNLAAYAVALQNS